MSTKIDSIKTDMAKAVSDAKANRPLIGSITNNVTMNFVANAQLAVGGSAAIVYLPEECQLLANMVDAFYINVGTLQSFHEQAMPPLAAKLNEIRTPWVLDPVAVGIGALRNRLLQEFKNCKPSIIRGNASEIMKLANLWGLTKDTDGNVRGVDSTDLTTDAKLSAEALARWTGGAVSVSGKTDLITDGSTTVHSFGGSPFFESITGAGCSLGGVSAVYAAVTRPFIAALCASQIYNYAGRVAQEKALGPGSFQVAFLDALYNALSEDVANNPIQIEEAG